MRCRGDRQVQHGLKAGELPVAVHQSHRALLLGRHLGVPLQRRRGDVDQEEFTHQLGCRRGQPYRCQPAQRHAHNEVGARCEVAKYRRQGGGVVLWRVVAALAPGGMAVTGKVHRQRRLTKADDHGVPGVRVLSAAVQEDNTWGPQRR